MREGVGVAGRFKSYNRTTLSVMVGKEKERRREREKPQTHLVRCKLCGSHHRFFIITLAFSVNHIPQHVSQRPVCIIQLPPDFIGLFPVVISPLEDGGDKGGSIGTA